MSEGGPKKRRPERPNAQAPGPNARTPGPNARTPEPPEPPRPQARTPEPPNARTPERPRPERPPPERPNPERPQARTPAPPGPNARTPRPETPEPSGPRRCAGSALQHSDESATLASSAIRTVTGKVGLELSEHPDKLLADRIESSIRLLSYRLTMIDCSSIHHNDSGMSFDGWLSVHRPRSRPGAMRLVLPRSPKRAAVRHKSRAGEMRFQLEARTGQSLCQISSLIPSMATMEMLW
jgi:hypothetical protein